MDTADTSGMSDSMLWHPFVFGFFLSPTCALVACAVLAGTGVGGGAIILLSLGMTLSVASLPDVVAHRRSKAARQPGSGSAR